jgi:hypothetical protein
MRKLLRSRRIRANLIAKRSNAGELILQADRLITRTNAETYADARLIVCICRDHHAWKSLGGNARKSEYDQLVRTLIAAALAEAGAHVTPCARSLSEIASAAEAIHERGGQADILQLDVTNVEVVMTTVQWPSRSVFWSITRARIGSNTVEKVSVADCDFVMNLNVRAAYFMAQAVAKRLIEASLAGSIINMSSQMGHVGSADRSLYCASKRAMEGFSKSMAIDLAPHRIRANC